MRRKPCILDVLTLLRISVKIFAVMIMKIYEKNNSVILEGVTDFNPVHTFDCGQCFRWEMLSDGSYTGVAFSKPVNIRCENDVIIIKNITLQEFESQWKHYLDLDVDYSVVKQEISVDENVIKAMEFGWGIKILNQEMFECLIPESKK